jgi:predicted GNAT superfamily acetyltransferase
MELEIRRLTSPAELQKCTGLQERIWGLDCQEILSPITLSTLSMDDPIVGLVIGGYLEDELVGFQVFLATTKPGLIYGHMFGILPEHRDSGLGHQFHLKMFGILDGYGLDQVCWTYEPLEGRNAHSYLNKLGGRVVKYMKEHFQSGGQLNLGLPMDRVLFMRGLADPPAPSPGLSLAQALESLPLATADDMPPSPEVLVRIPGDLQQLKQDDMQRALKYRLDTRAIFTEYLNQRGYVGDRLYSDQHGGERRNFYLLRKPGQD